MSDPVETKTEDANHLLATRRTLVLLKASVAEDRWRRFQRASHQPLSLRLGSRLLSRANGLLARGKWPGRALMVWGSGLWNPAIDANLGREPGVTRGLVEYTRAGPEPLAHPRALFDQTWYLEASRDLVGSRWSPLAHR